MIHEWFQHTNSGSHESNQLVDDISKLYINNHPPLGLDSYEESKDLKIVEMTSFLDMDNNQYDDSDELNVDMPISISLESQSLTDHEGDNFL